MVDSVRKSSEKKKKSRKIGSSPTVQQTADSGAWAVLDIVRAQGFIGVEVKVGEAVEIAEEDLPELLLVSQAQAPTTTAADLLPHPGG